MNLASVQKITAITPIPGADAIETAHVLGWRCVEDNLSFKVINNKFLLRYGE